MAPRPYDDYAGPLRPTLPTPRAWRERLSRRSGPEVVAALAPPRCACGTELPPSSNFCGHCGRAR